MHTYVSDKPTGLACDSNLVAFLRARDRITRVHTYERLQYSLRFSASPWARLNETAQSRKSRDAEPARDQDGNFSHHEQTVDWMGGDQRREGDRGRKTLHFVRC